MRQVLITAGLLTPLGLDTFALAAALGLAGLAQKDRLRITLVFTAFEAGMPILGVLVGRAAGSALGDWAGYAAVALLFAIGVWMVWPGRDDKGEERRLRLLASARGVAVLTLGLSISVDELTVGISAGLLGLSLLVTVIWVGVQAFIATQVGLRVGTRLGEELRERAEWIAGVALIAMATVLLVLKLTGI
jgi:manganese efflux pump family protein